LPPSSACFLNLPLPALDQADLGDVFDAAAVTAYRRRFSDLDAELDAADHRGDQSGAAKLSAERDALLGQLKRCRLGRTHPSQWRLLASTAGAAFRPW
jgi:hypothetical protein